MNEEFNFRYDMRGRLHCGKCGRLVTERRPHKCPFRVSGTYIHASYSNVEVEERGFLSLVDPRELSY